MICGTDKSTPGKEKILLGKEKKKGAGETAPRLKIVVKFKN
jgi:hypothetical protein